MLSATHVSEPHRAIICGQTGCGKTQIVLDELLHPERGSYHNTFDIVFILCPTWKRNRTYLDRPWLWRGPRASRFYFIEPGERLHDWLRLRFSLYADTPTLYIVDDMSASRALTKKKDMLSELAFSGRQKLVMQNNLYGCSCRSITPIAKICVSRQSGWPFSTVKTGSHLQMRMMRTMLCHTSFAIHFALA